LLIAGATGSGKSVCINTIINSFLLRSTPEEVRFIMIDPKRIELAGYEGVPHLIENVVTDNEDAMKVLNWAVKEMERRYSLLQKYKVRNLKDYNIKLEQLAAEKRGTEEELADHKLPYIIIIIDELADLMMTVGKDVERPLTRLAQMARAIGIHLILATQRPSSKIITGIIKTNFPCRIAFKVGSKIDSRVIIDANGAEKLLGRGDMLFLPPGSGDVDRIHGAFISDAEIENIVDYLMTQPKPEQEIMILDEDENELNPLDYDDEKFPEAAVYVVQAGNASVSMLQRHLKIGYARAGRLIDKLEQAGIIGEHKGSKPREVLATEEDLKIYGFMEDNGL
jgi:S-DNA-T family DNA segregation ATPase FtsK/SpoIIIE